MSSLSIYLNVDGSPTDPTSECLINRELSKLISYAPTLIKPELKPLNHSNP